MSIVAPAYNLSISMVKYAQVSPKGVSNRWWLCLVFSAPLKGIYLRLNIYLFFTTYIRRYFQKLSKLSHAILIALTLPFIYLITCGEFCVSPWQFLELCSPIRHLYKPYLYILRGIVAL